MLAIVNDFYICSFRHHNKSTKYTVSLRFAILEARTIYWVRIFAAIMASVIIIRLSTMLIISSHKKHLILGSIILLIVVTSVSSTL